MSTAVRVERDGPVVTVLLSQPERRNAVDGPTAQALADAFRAFDADPDARVGVLHGEGGAFCAGADLQAAGTADGNRVEADGDGPMGPTRLRLSKQLLTDNGSGYRSTIHGIACRTLAIRHLRTRAYRPQTNGKAERFIRTLLTGWAYGAIYRDSRHRTRALDGWPWHYNHHRKHSALGHKPPIARVNERTNLLGSYN